MDSPDAQPVRAGWGSGGLLLRSAAGCGHSSSARAPRGCPATPSPPPWRRSSVPVGRRSAASPPSPSTSTVVESSCQGHADGLLLMPKHRAQPPLTTSPSSSRELPAELIHCWPRKNTEDNANLSEPVVVVVCGWCWCWCGGVCVCVGWWGEGRRREEGEGRGVGGGGGGGGGRLLGFIWQTWNDEQSWKKKEKRKAQF